MNFYKRAIISIKRRPGKNLVLLMLVFILGTIITGAIAVENAIANTDANLRNSMRPIVSFYRDYNLINEYIDETGQDPIIYPLTANIVRQIADLPQVSQHNYSVTAELRTNQLNEYIPDDVQIMGDGDTRGLFSLQGTSTEELLEIREDMIIIVEGREFTTTDLTSQNEIQPIIISHGLARANNLSVGSILDLAVEVMYPQLADFGVGYWDSSWGDNPENIFATENFQLEVIGLFDVVDAENNSNNHNSWQEQMRAEQMKNRIFASNNAVGQINNFLVANYSEARQQILLELGMSVNEDIDFNISNIQSVRSVMELYDSSYLDEFRVVASELLPVFWIIDDLTDSFADVASSMQIMQNIASWVLWISLGATLLILSLLITLFLRDRRYEMGVYSALGERKRKVILQILLEVVAIAFIGITLSVFTGSIISETMSRSMLRNHLIAQQYSDEPHMGFSINTTATDLANMGFSNDMTTEEMLEAFEMSLDIGTVGVFYAIGLGAVVLSTIIPVLYIVTLNPKKVLMDS